MRTFSVNSSDAAFRPAGFNELRAMFDWADEVVMKYADIRDYMTENHMFSEGQISGLIQRACKKGLLKQIDRGVYYYNIRYPEPISDDDIGDIGTVNWDVSEKVKTILHNALSAAMRISVADVTADDISVYQSVINNIGQYVEGLSEDLDVSLYDHVPQILRKRLSDCLVSAEQKTRNMITLFDIAEAPCISMYSDLSAFVLRNE